MTARSLSLVVSGAIALAALAAFASACGAHGPKSPDHAAPEWTSNAASGLGAPATAAARAMLAAIQSGYYDPGWNCEGAASDLRATLPSEKEKVAALGSSLSLVVVTVRMSLVSPAKSDIALTDVPDYPGKGPVRVFVHGSALVSPDAKVSWSDLKAYAAALEEPNTDRATMTALAAPLRTELSRLLDAAASPACALPITTGDDIDHLPYPLDKDERDVIVAGLAEVSRGAPRVCKVVKQAAGPWEAHVSHLEAVYIGQKALVKLHSKAKLVNGALCLGAVSVVKAVAM
jgi:hypothetical protein